MHALIPCVAAYNTALVSLIFGTVMPTSFNILMEMFLTFLFHFTSSLVCEPHPFCCSWSYETHVNNNEGNGVQLHRSDQYIVALLIQEGPYKDFAGERHCPLIKVNTCTNFVLDRLKNRKMEKSRF